MESRSNVNLALLRSQLVQLCPTLKNLTIVDLESCKWTLRRNIYLSLFESNPRLVAFHNNLEELMERRNSELAIQKQRKVPRETIVEHEHMFRSSFMSVVLDVLLYMRWPPVLEAFSDNLGQLISDIDFNTAAMAYIASSSLGPSQSALGSGAESSRGTYDRTDSSVLTSPSRSSSSARGSKSSGPVGRPGSSGHSAPSSARGRYQHEPPSPPSDSLAYEQVERGGGDNGVSDSFVSNISQISGPSRATATATVNGSVLQAKDSQYEGAQRTIELLLRQNELLQGRVSQLQRGVTLRAQCEERLEHVLGDVLEVVAGIGDTAGGPQGRPRGGNKGSEDAEGGLFAGINFDYGTTPVGGGVSTAATSSSTTSWKHVHSRLNKLRLQWVEARRSVRGGGGDGRPGVAVDFHEYAQTNSGHSSHVSVGEIHAEALELGIGASRVMDTLYDFHPGGSGVRANVLVDYACDPRIDALQGSVLALKNRSDTLLYRLASIVPYSTVAGSGPGENATTGSNTGAGGDPAGSGQGTAYNKYSRTSPCLQRLIAEINTLSTQRKPNFEARLPGLVEQSLAENAIIVRALGRSNSILTQWYSGTAQSLSKHLGGLLDRAGQGFKVAVQRLDGLSVQFGQLVELIQDAEAVRVATPLYATGQQHPPTSGSISARPGSASSSASVSSSASGSAGHSPWRTLCRGLCGEEVAALLQFLSMHRSKLERYGNELQDAYTELDTSSSAALREVGVARDRLSRSFEEVGGAIEHLNGIVF